MLLIDDVLKMPREKVCELLEKHQQAETLYYEVDDFLIVRFFNIDSYDMLDDKIEVLQALKDGKPPDEIPKYYDVLEDYPEDYSGEEVLWD